MDLSTVAVVVIAVVVFVFDKKRQSEPWLGGLVGEGAAAGQWGGGE